MEGINLFMIDVNGKALESTTNEFKIKYKNIKILSKQLDLTKLSNQLVYSELDEDLS